MGEISDRERATVSAFFDAIWARFNGDRNTAKAAITSVIEDLALGSRAQAFEYMNKVIEGQGD